MPPMFVALLAAAVPAALASLPSSRAPSAFRTLPPFDTFWLDVPLDHNDPTSATFPLRYLVYSGYYTPNRSSTAPILLCAGGESDVSAGYYHNGFLFEIAQSVGAFMLWPEHRFFGDSIPYWRNGSGINVTYSSAVVRHLTPTNALLDYVLVLRHVRRMFSLPPTLPVFAYGGSYPGMLAGWLRTRHPADIDGAWAASAPYAWFSQPPPFNTSTFWTTSSAVFARTNASCTQIARDGFAQLHDLFAEGSAASRQRVADELGLCDVPPPISGGRVGAARSDNVDAKDVLVRLQAARRAVGGGGGAGDDSERTVAEWIRNAFAMLAMLNYPEPNAAFYGLPGWPLDTSCTSTAAARAAGKSALAALGEVSALMYAALYGESVGAVGREGGSDGRRGVVAVPMLSMGGAGGLSAVLARAGARRARVAAASISSSSTSAAAVAAPSTPRCFNVSDEFYVCGDPTGCGGSRTDPNALSWDYLACSTIPIPIGSTNVTDIFPAHPYSIQDLRAYCAVAWPSAIPQQGSSGPWSPATVATSRVLMTSGAIDPWGLGGITQNVSTARGVVGTLVTDAAHHLDLWAPSPADPPSVTAARAFDRALLLQWFADAAVERQSRTA